MIAASTTAELQFHDMPSIWNSLEDLYQCVITVFISTDVKLGHVQFNHTYSISHPNVDLRIEILI